MDDKISMPKSEELRQLVRVNEKLGKLIELNVEIRDIEKANGEKLDTIHMDKLEQKIGDWWSRVWALVALSITGLTLYFSDSPFAQGVRLWLNQLGGL